jgi:hypothetical protein
MSLSSKKSAGKAIAAPATMCNQLIADFLQLGHFIFHSANTVPHSPQDQMILVILYTLTAVKPTRRHFFDKRQTKSLYAAAV